MKLTNQQIKAFSDDGYLLLEDLFSEGEIGLMRAEMARILGDDCPRRILEKNGAIRSFFAPELSSDLFKKILRLKKVAMPAAQLIGSEVYVHQTKLNTKHAMVGDWWDWHQDFTFWKEDDGMPEPRALTAMIYLNDVNEFNGPLLLIPGSHKEYVEGQKQKDLVAKEEGGSWFDEYKISTPYMSALTADLKYTLDRATIARWIQKKGIKSAKARCGSVLFFHGSIFHASSNNLSPWDRHAFLITYNSIWNKLNNIEFPRPEFIASRQYSPIIPIEDEVLV
jgi:ectoine hydroxylase